MSIGDFCKRQIATVPGQATVEQAARIMKDGHVGDVVVVEESPTGLMPIGIVTDRDIVTLVVAEGVMTDSIRVREIMAAEPVCLHEDEGLHQAISRMVARSVRRAPVVGKEGQLVGIISVDDLYELVSTELADLARISSNQIALEREDLT